MTGTSPTLSPLARLLLERHEKDPRHPQYLLAVLGSMFRERDIERLDGAYQELEARGLVEQAGAVRFFGKAVPLFTLTASAPPRGGEGE